MVIYLDLVFFLNSAADALALYVTSRLSGLTPRLTRVVAASFLGGIYAVLCSVPLFYPLGNLIPQILVASLLVWIVFGIRTIFLRLCLLFFVLSCAMGGVFLAVAQSFDRCGVSDTLEHMNWKVFFLVGGLCYFFLSVVFRGSAKHYVSGEISEGSLRYGGRSVPLNVLLDTGHTLRNPYTGNEVLIVWLDATRELWRDEEWAVLSGPMKHDAAWCLEQLTEISQNRFWIIPYRAVGISHGSLLCFAAEDAVVGNTSLGEITVALSDTPLSDGGGCNALWGGRLNKEGNVL